MEWITGWTTVELPLVRNSCSSWPSFFLSFKADYAQLSGSNSPRRPYLVWLKSDFELRYEKNPGKIGNFVVNSNLIIYFLFFQVFKYKKKILLAPNLDRKFEKTQEIQIRARKAHWSYYTVRSDSIIYQKAVCYVAIYQISTRRLKP